MGSLEYTGKHFMEDGIWLLSLGSYIDERPCQCDLSDGEVLLLQVYEIVLELDFL